LSWLYLGFSWLLWIWKLHRPGPCSSLLLTSLMQNIV
jgi:hypothetical protein